MLLNQGLWAIYAHCTVEISLYLYGKKTSTLIYGLRKRYQNRLAQHQEHHFGGGFSGDCSNKETSVEDQRNNIVSLAAREEEFKETLAIIRIGHSGVDLFSRLQICSAC